jgi:hypothetical protein
MLNFPKWGTIRLILLFCSVTSSLWAEPVRVRYVQGSAHGFLVLKTLEGQTIATGEVLQTVHGAEVTSRLVFHFRDGSIDDDLTVFSQRNVFKLIRDHHIQKGPSFPKPMDVTIDTAAGLVTSRDRDGKATEHHVDLPTDLANGLPPNLLLNILPSVAETKVSYLAFDDRPRLIHLSIKPTEQTPFTVAGMKRKATNYTIHVELGGVAGVIAPIIGKQPIDDHIWIESGNPPAFIAEEGQLYLGGPIWRMEQVSPSFPQ